MSEEQNNNTYLNKYRDEQGRFRSKAKRKKYCSCCGKLLWKHEFYKSKGRYTSFCKECYRARYRANYVPRRKDGVYQDEKGRLVEWKNGHMSLVWSDQQILELKKYYPTTRNKELMELFMMSEYSIMKKAKELGLEKDKDYLMQQSKMNGYYGSVVSKRNRQEKKRAYLSQASSSQSK